MIIDITKYWAESEIFHQAELSSKIIYSMQQHSKTVLVSMEARSIRHSGLNLFLDALCDFWGWDPKNIVIVTNNCFELYDRYTIEPIVISCDVLTHVLPQHVSWNGSKSYGMFLGRATAERLQAVSRHQNFDFRDQGLTSFHHDVKKHIDTRELVKYLCESDSRWSELMQMAPYSDIGEVNEQIISKPNMSADWKTIYQQIALELVFETSTADDVCSFSEKILRPMIYGRPFMLISSKHSMQKMSNPEVLAAHLRKIMPKWNFKYYDDFAQNWTGVKLFENVFGTEYDNCSGIDRVNCVFDILHTLIRTGKINKIHDKCRQDIENNYKCVMLWRELLQKMGNWQKFVYRRYANTK